MIEKTQRLFKRKYLIVLLVTVLLFALMGFLYNVFIVNRQKSMVIEFNYPGAEKGLNPDGSTFEISDLKSTEVIEKAKQNLKADIDTEFLRSRVFITSKITGQMLDKIVSAVQDEKNSVYMPTTFYIYYSQKNKFSENESEIFMENLSKAYTEYFTEKYSEKNDVLIFNPEDYDFESKDYIEIYTTLKNKADSMQSYIKNHQNENRAFYADDRDNLGMAAKKIENFSSINLEKFYAYIVQNAITKNNDSTLKRTDYIINENTLEYNKLFDASNIAREALAQYEPGITAVAYIPSVDSKQNYYMSRTKTGLDELTKKSYENGISASIRLKTINKYKSIYERYAAYGNSDEYKISVAENMINDMTKELSDISQEVLKTDNEYLQHKTMNYFNIRLPKESTLRIKLIIKFMILGFILALAGIILFEFFAEDVSKKYTVLEKSFKNIVIVKNKGR